MSGIEVAGLAFGVLPILVEVVKSYKDVSKRVRTLRHHSREVKSISEQVKVHNGIFLNEIRLLLRSVEVEDEVEAMLSDGTDQRWSSRHLNEKLRTVLVDSFEACCSIIEETKDAIESMQQEMGKFDVLLLEKVEIGGPYSTCSYLRIFQFRSRISGRDFRSHAQTSRRSGAHIFR